MRGRHVARPGARCRCRPPRSRAASPPAASCARGRRRRSRPRARRGPSSSSRSGPASGAPPRRASCPRGAGSPRPRPPPARRCRRCSSGRRPSWPRWRSTRTNVSPSVALRRWPMCAALLGLMLVCSTITRPGAAAARRAPAQVRAQLAGERAAVEEQVHVAAARHLRPPHAGRCRQRRRQPSPRSRAACGAAPWPGRRARSAPGRPARAAAGTGTTRRPAPHPARAGRRPSPHRPDELGSPGS